MVATAPPPRSTRIPGAPEPAPAPGARFRGRWRVALRVGARDARRHKGRTALVTIMVTLPVALGTIAATVLWSIQMTPERRIAEQLGPDLAAAITYTDLGGLTQAPDGDAYDGGEAPPGSVTAADLEAIITATLPGSRISTAIAEPVLVSGQALQATEFVVQADLTDPAVAGAFALRDGVLPGPGQIALAERTVQDLGLALGDTVDLRLPGALGDEADLGSATLSGVLTMFQPQGASALVDATGPLTAPHELANSDWAGAQSWFVAGDTPVTWDDVLTLNGRGLVVTSRDVITNPPHASAVPYQDAMPAMTSGDFMMTWGTLGAVVAVALIEAVLLIGPAFAVGARRSARALAVIAANGGTARTLRAVVLGTGVVIGSVASLTGTLLGLPIATALVAASDDVRFLRVPWPLVAGITAVGVLLAAAGAWLPARGAAKADILAVLGGRRGEVTTKRWPAIVGTVAAVGGFTAAVMGGTATQPPLIVGGVVVGEIGLVLACGGIVAGLGRLAARLPLTWRFALRDASRHRSRTAPAIAAVLVATAGASAGIVYATAQAQHGYRSHAQIAAPGTLVLSVHDDEVILTDQDIATIRDITADLLSGVELLPVTTLIPPAGDGITTTVTLTDAPASGPGSPDAAIPGPVLDDGRLVDVLGLPDPAAARAALEDGRVVVPAGRLAADGTATLAIETWAADTEHLGTPLTSREVSLAATAVGDVLAPSNTNLPIVPPSALPELADAGVTTRIGGLVSAEPIGLTSAEHQTLQARINEAIGSDAWGFSNINVNVGEDPGADALSALPLLIILGSGAVLALAAAWIAAALAATESRPDLATLTAVGAPPRMRKRIVAAQAGTIAGIGALIGVLSGYPLGAAFVLFERHRGAETDLAWGLTFPWPWLLALLVGLPVLAVAAARLATRSRLVLTRRIAG